MKNLLLCTFFLTLFGIQPADAQFSLRVGDPRFSWSTYQGTIEDATLSIRPMGIYWEYGLYLTFSARGTPYDAGDSLEVVLKFELPENAIVHDSWLWIYDDIVKAKILDRWTASNIYEGIVQRRRDPSILYKNSATNYELRVFPMAGNETRKVKITYLMPTEWGPNNVWAGLPMQILKTSRFGLPSLGLLAWPNMDWNTPSISNGAGLISWTEGFDEQEGTFFKTEIPNVLFNAEPLLSFRSPLLNGPYLRIYNDTDDGGTYQLAVMPKTSDAISNPQKILLLFDKDMSGGNTSLSVLADLAKTQILSLLRPTDSFNIIYSNLPINRVSDKWLPANQTNIDIAFANLNLSVFSNLGSLILDGIDFIKENGSEGSIMLFSNAAQYYTNELAAGFHDQILSVIGNDRPKMHIVDYRTVYNPWTQIGGVGYYGNDYLYFRLAQSTSGSFQSARSNGTLEKAITSAFTSTHQLIENFDFHTTLENGFCYGRYFLNNPVQQFINKPVLQVGRYSGNLPFVIEMAGEINDEVFYNSIHILQEEALHGDSLCKEMWFGKKIQHLESTPQTNSVIFDILENSLGERVLSRYTAFLCLEDTSLICDECLDETQFTSTETPTTALDTVLTVFPNPFSESVKITLNTQLLKKTSPRTSVEIYNLSGQLVRQFESSTMDGTTPLQIVWDGTHTHGEAVSAGVYILIANSGEWSQAIKLIKQ